MNPTYIILIFGGLVMFAIAAIAVAIVLRRDPIQGLSNNANAVVLGKNGIVYAAKGDGVYYANTNCQPAAAGNNCNQPALTGNVNNFYFNSAPTDNNRPADAEAKPPAPGPDAVR